MEEKKLYLNDKQNNLLPKDEKFLKILHTNCSIIKLF